MNLCKNTKAFTIVELLVVIVVIGILAAISLVSYSGINLKAITVALQSDLSSNAKLLKLYNVDHGYYPDSIDANYCPSAPDTDARYCLKTSNGNSLSYAGGGQSFTLTATNSNGLSYSINENSQITENASSNSSFANVWDASDYDYGSAIAKTSDGGYVTVGGTYSYSDANSYSDAFISKYSSDGVLSWMKTWGGSSDDDAQDIIQSSDGGFVMVGYTRSYGLGDGAGGDDVFYRKI